MTEVLPIEIKKIIQFFRLSVAYLSKNNPVILLGNTVSTHFSEFLSFQKKSKIARYRVNHVKYRLYQMEQIIENGNPYNLVEGKKLDRLQ